MSVRSFYRNVKHFSGKHVAGSYRAAYHTCSRAVNSGVGSLRSSQSEFDYGAFAGCRRHAVGFGCDKRLVIYHAQKRGFNKLSLNERCLYYYERLHGENYFALTNGVKIAGEFESAQIFQKFGAESVERRKIFDVIIGEIYILDIIHHLLKI